MRLSYRQVVAALCAVAVVALAGCQGSDVPIQPNGPNNQFFSTNNALVRFLQASPDFSPASSGIVDVYVDGSLAFAGVHFGQVAPINPIPPFGIGGYVSVPSGSVLVEIYQAGTKTLIAAPFVFSTKTGDKFLVASAGTIANGTFQLLAIKEVHFNNGSSSGGFGLAFDEASPNAANGTNVTLSYNCDACSPGIIDGSAALGSSLPVNYAPPSNGYTFTATGANTVGPTALGIPGAGLDLTIYEIDAGGSNSTLAATVDQNG